ncbi:hypothetical protein ACFSTF_02420 [Terrilactibacillus laevilacticus]|uniref:Oligosaccharide repeat unit polymerase n=2 Tax=Terrilactibacillus laevilacticus TaxID=1380157 RepID=A0ABW5PMS0_9BACI
MTNLTSKLKIGIVFILTLYNTTESILYNFGYRPFWWASEKLIYSATEVSFFSIIIIFILLFTKLGFSSKDISMIYVRISQLEKKINNISKERKVLLYAIFSILMMINWIQLLKVGLGNVIHSARRVYSADILITHSFYYQLFSISLSLIIIICIINLYKKKSSNLLLVLSSTLFIFFWLPSIIIGSRKELLIVMLGIWAIKLKSRFFRFLIITLIIIFLSMPLFFDGFNLIDSLHEFALPQYILFAFMEYDIKGPFNYFSGLFFMVPSLLRPIHLIDMGSWFFTLKITNVGLGSHPFAEAYMNFGEFGLFIFPIIFIILTKFIIFLSKVNAAFWISGFPYLIFLINRSDFWTCIFFVFYTGLLFILFLEYPKKEKRN